MVSTPNLLTAGTAYLDPPTGQTSGWAAWAATGDAALALDPLSSHGMTTALWMGTKAGETASDWLAGKHATMNEYVAAVRGGLAAFLAQRNVYYANERRFSGSLFWSWRLAEHKH